MTDKVVNSTVQYRLQLACKALNGQVLTLTPHVVAFERHKPLAGSSVGTWSTTLKLDLNDAVASDLHQKLQGYVSDDDPGDLDIMEVAGQVEILSPMQLKVVDRTFREYIDELGNPIALWHISGQDWARAMTTSQLRLSAIFQSTSVEYVQNSIGVAAIFKTLVPQRMPGFIDTKTWETFSRLVVEGGSAAASDALRKLLGAALWGTWRLPGPDGKTLVELLNEHGWEGFGPVEGAPWQLRQLTNQAAITPDQLLRQFGCAAYNEVFYSYDRSGTRPAVIFRERPYGPGAWSRLPIADVTDRQTDISATASGNERYSMWKPLSAAVALGGADHMLDTAEGKIPIIELADLAAHGVRPFEASDDYFPPISRPNAQFLEWYRVRIGKARNWYYNNPKMLTGTATFKPACPRVKIGERVLLPLQYSFNYGTDGKPDVRRVPAIEAYVTNVTDVVTVEENGTPTSMTTIQFTRGQPPGGLPVPKISPWTKGAKVIQQRMKLGEGTIILGLTQYAVPFKVEYAFSDLRATVTIQPGEDQSINRIVIGQTNSGSHEATKYLYNPRLQTTHFEIDGKGTIWQLLDPLSHYALENIGEASVTIPKAIAIDLTGGGDIGFKVAQYDALQKLIATLRAHFGTIPAQSYPYRPEAVSIEDWRLDNGVPAGELEGVIARNQLFETSLAPSAPTDSDTAWNSQIRPRV